MGILRTIFYRLSPRLRFLVRRLVYAPGDWYDLLTGQRDEMTPPRSMIYTGAGDFREQGNRMLELFVEDGNLQANHHFLDVGSGIGRIAIPLTGFLDRSARYEGFDAIQQGVDWCRRKVSSRFPNFSFTYVPLQNDLYRNTGSDASKFTFPYDNDQFDFVAVISVFTHLLPEEVENYLQEIRRVLKPGGVCFGTFFLWDGGPAKGKNGFSFPHDYGHYRLMDKKVKRANVAYTEEYLQMLMSQNDLYLEKCRKGYWKDIANGESGSIFQDVLILRKIR